MIAVFGFSLSMISHKRVSNNALSIKQSIQIAQAYNKSQGNTDDVGKAIVDDDEDARAEGLCKLRICGPTGDSKYPYTYLYIFSSATDLATHTNYRIADGSKGKKQLEKKTTIKIKFQGDNNEYVLGKDDYVDICLSRTTGGFLAGSYKLSGSTGKKVPVKIIVTDSQKTVTLNLATFTGTVTKD